MFCVAQYLIFFWRFTLAKFERRLIPARRFNFDTTVGAIGSNEPKWQCNDVVLMFERPGECVREDVDKFMEFFEPPFGTLSLFVAIPYMVTMAHQIYSRLD